MIFQGKQYNLRGSNKKYPELDNLDEVFREIVDHYPSITAYAKDKGVPQNSVRYRLFRYLPQEMLDQLPRERRYHNRKVSKIKVSD